MGTFPMPTVKQFLDKKTIYGPKKDPVWVYLEKEMRANAEQKPYNEKVGKWLKYLRDLKHYYHTEAKRQERTLQREVGPLWYIELSSNQREVLGYLKSNIHQDLLEDLPVRTRKSLSDLGITMNIPKKILLKAMVESMGDAGVFIWCLYSEVYKKPPSELRGEYDMNAMIMMSCLVFIDLEECIKCLEKLTGSGKKTVVPPVKKVKKYYEPKCRYGEYLQKMYVPCYCNHPSKGQEKSVRAPRPIETKIRLRSDDSYENLRYSVKFLEKRKERNQKQKQMERVCNYKFWEPPSTLRNTDPKMVAHAEKLKMLKKRPKFRHKSALDNVQFNVGPVVFAGNNPYYLLNNICVLGTGYVTIHGGITLLSTGEYCTVIAGYWKYPREVEVHCDHDCDCVEKWEPTVMEYLKESKCKCGHLYDLYHEGKATEKYFYPPTRSAPHWFDKAKIYQLDPMEDFIKETVRLAVQSGEETPEPSEPGFSASGLKEKDLLAAFLADLSDTPLLIPHLPQANLLNNLQEWVRKRVKGAVDPGLHKQLILRSLRRWLWLKHMDFRGRAYQIPFTLKELKYMTWQHRDMVMQLFKILLNDFVTRNRLRQLEQSRLWWSTMTYDMYPSKAFLDIYFTYMPGRMKDTYIIDPFSSDRTPKFGAKTCPLNL
ncbi:hypothetical protein MSG28_010260 [Choristoneura fumiferana]|uniref:Uncharacterized protein n=1 Tax=Choristoneura fumiferana TaxID=7141 RepID=A0ACC0KJX8_CHOFU|nr:hypothetical protein MSG28_010260 [Choristoneura fumiferana]